MSAAAPASLEEAVLEAIAWSDPELAERIRRINASLGD
jgi:hypothetical protein